jgi:hypothetical protein
VIDGESVASGLIEMVYGVIEVKTKLNIGRLTNEAGKIALFQEWWSGHAPRYLVFSYGDTWKLVESSGVRTFLTNLVYSLESMLPLSRAGMGFDLVNLSHYNMEVMEQRAADSPGDGCLLIHIQISISTIAPRANGPCVGERSLAPIVAGRCMPSAELLTPFCYLT